jgi:hypothetical protein
MKIIKPFFWVVAMVSVAACADNHKMVAQSAITVDVLQAGIQCGGNAVDVNARWIENATELESFSRQRNLAIVDVDFSKSMVLLVEMGEKPTLGYRLGLAQPEAQVIEGHAEVILEWQEPPKGMMVGQMMTSPCILLKLARDHYQEVRVKDRLGNQKVTLSIPAL